jgi:hypothetical protein
MVITVRACLWIWILPWTREYALGITLTVTVLGHCDEPTETGMGSSGGSATATATCEPHDDHWHCPPGVPEPTTPPAATATEEDDHEATATTCEPHDDHWHCPSGVPEPTSPPGTSASMTSSFTPNSTSSAAPSTLPDFQATAAREGVASHILGISAVVGLITAFVW